MAELVLTDKQAEHIDDMTRHLMIMGSAGSGKTIFASIKVILYALKYPNARIGVFRQTLPSLRETAWREIRGQKKAFHPNETGGRALQDVLQGSSRGQ